MNTTSNPTLFEVPDANFRVNGRAKWWVPFLRWPLLILGYLFTPWYAVSFGLLDKRLARQYERQLAADVRFALGFLFIVTNRGSFRTKAYVFHQDLTARMSLLPSISW
jgi:hypothetical protein